MMESRHRFGVVIAILMTLGLLLPSCRAIAATSPKVSVIAPPQRSTPDQPLRLTVAFQWTGEEDTYRFLIPRLGLDNLELLRVRQTVEKKGGRIQKSFIFELKPLHDGPAEIHPFRFGYQSEISPNITYQHIERVVVQIKKPLLQDLKQHALLWLAGSGFVAITIFFLRRRHIRAKKVMQTRIPVSLEKKHLALLDEKPSAIGITLSADQLFHIFHSYCGTKWGIRLESSHPKSENEFSDHCPLDTIARITSELEEYRFSGEVTPTAQIRKITEDVRIFIQKYTPIKTA